MRELISGCFPLTEPATFLSNSLDCIYGEVAGNSIEDVAFFHRAAFPVS